MEFSKTVVILEEDGGGRKIGGEGIYKVFPPLAPALLGRRGGEKLYALDSQVSGLSRRVIQTGVTAARFIVFVNLGRVTSRRGSGYPSTTTTYTCHDVYRRRRHHPSTTAPVSFYPPPLSSALSFRRSISAPPSG